MQSINPYHPKIFESVEVLGLDTEYVPHLNKASDLLSWQLSGSGGERIVTNAPLTIENLYNATKSICPKTRKVFVYVVYFSMAELQFFNLDEWVVSEFKGKYSVKQTYGEGQLMVVDLANWYVGKKLADVAKLWGFQKIDYDIGKKVEAVGSGEVSRQELVEDKEFREYALNDARITRGVYLKMREYFMAKGVDIISTTTPANTSASMFRLGVQTAIGQRNTKLRTLALKCCWGGRMECIYRGVKPQTFEYDATAHHPSSAIALGALPLEKDWIQTTNLKALISGISGLAHVYFSFPDDEQYPCLPVYHDGCLMFPLQGDSYCSVSEIRLAIKKKAKVMVFEGQYYTKGTTILQDYLKGLQAERNASTDESARQMLKLLSNSVIGKLFQKRVGSDLSEVQDYALKNNIPYEVALKLEGVEFGSKTKVSIGSCFYPEWYALILGFARANIGSIASTHKALMISSDSFTTESDLGKDFEHEGIHYGLKASGDYVGYRSRFYRVGDKLAHHAVHNREAAKGVLSEFLMEDRYSYSLRRFRHLKEAWAHQLPFGSQMERNMSTALGYDDKRKMSDDGWSTPHKTIADKGGTDCGINDDSGGLETGAID